MKDKEEPALQRNPRAAFPRERHVRDGPWGRKDLGVWKGQEGSKVVDVEGGQKYGQRARPYGQLCAKSQNLSSAYWKSLEDFKQGPAGTCQDLSMLTF